MAGARRLGLPRPLGVRAGRRGVPVEVGGQEVEAVLEEWVLEEEWWTQRPIRRRYFELLLKSGRDEVVFCDLVAGRWFSQRA